MPGLVQGGVALAPRRAFWSPVSAIDMHGRDFGEVKTRIPRPLGDVVGPRRRTPLQTVIDGDQTEGQTVPRRDERARRSQRHRIGPARARHHDGFAARQRTDLVLYGVTYRRNALR